MQKLLVLSSLCLLLSVGLLAVNAALVGSQTRGAVARDGGVLIETDIATANVKVEVDGPPIVLIHGFGAALDWWDEVAPQLAAGHRVIRLDLLGHGGTEAPRSGYEIERQAALVKSVLDELDVGRTAVVGHSMGGEVAVALAEAYPGLVERLVLIDTPSAPERSFSSLARLAFLRPIGEVLWRFRTDAVLRQGLGQGFAPGFNVPDKFVADLWQLTYSAFHNAHAESVAFLAARATPARLAAIKPIPPLLVLFGREDALIPVESAKQFQRITGARLVMLDGVGHSPMVEAPTKTLDLITEFIRKACRGTEDCL